MEETASLGERLKRGSLAAGLFGVLLAALSISQGVRAEDVGAIAGEFSVASGNIPIQMPPGRAGMQSEVSLNYTGQGGNGFLGFGWYLGGLSTILRCPATVAQDGVRLGVNLDQGDKFCLDGQRLIAVSGVYGAVGTEYRTKIDGFSKITSVGGSLTQGPDSWIAQTKFGQIFELGNPPDSKRQPATQVNRITDAAGNETIYSYHNQNDAYYLTRIDYVGRSIRFDYDPNGRPDKTTAYFCSQCLAERYGQYYSINCSS